MIPVGSKDWLNDLCSSFHAIVQNACVSLGFVVSQLPTVANLNSRSPIWEGTEDCTAESAIEE